MHGRELSPTLAFQEAREACADLAAIFAASELHMAMPEAALLGEQARIHYDEQVRVRLHLRLPSLPSRLPPPREALEKLCELDAAMRQRLPPSLVVLLTALQLRVQTTFHTSSASPLSVYTWQGLSARTDFQLRRWNDANASDSSVRPLSDDTEPPGMVYDTATKAWHLSWHCDLAVSYLNARGSDAALRIDADLCLRLDLGTLTAQSDAPRPQTPFHFTAHSVHPYMVSSDAYMIDANLLGELASGVKIPDETPEQRHDHLASQLTLLPASMLAPGVLGTDVVAPWNEALQLAQRMRRAKELEAAAMASDADIALSSWSSPPKPAAGSMLRTSSQPTPGDAHTAPEDAVDVPTLALSGPVALRRTAHVDVSVGSLVTVRMRALPRLYPTKHGARAQLVCVELESTSHDTTLVLHSVSMHVLGAAQRGADASLAPDSNDVHICVEPLGEAHGFPLRLEPHSQHNLLYTVRVQCAYMDVYSAVEALSTWMPCRRTRVVLHGTPVRHKESTQSTCMSEWNGTMDLRLAQLDVQRAMVAEQAVRRAAGANDANHAAMAQTTLADARAPPPPPKPWRAWTPSTPTATALTNVRHAPAWSQTDASTPGWDSVGMALAHGTVLAQVDVTQGASTWGLARVQLHVSLSHLGTHTVDVEVRWLADPHTARPNVVLPEHSSVCVGRLAPGQTRAVEISLHVLEAGYHALGHIGVHDRATGAACVLQHVGAVYIATEDGSTAT